MGQPAMSLDRCGKECLARSTCNFAIYNLGTQKCSEYATCDSSKATGLEWTVLEKVSKDGDGRRTPNPSPPPTPIPAPSGKCCREKCSSSSECADSCSAAPDGKCASTRAPVGAGVRIATA